MYFCDFDEVDKNLSLNPDEFTKYKWVAIDEAISAYEQSTMPIFFP